MILEQLKKKYNQDFKSITWIFKKEEPKIRRVKIQYKICRECLNKTCKKFKI